MTAAVNTIKVSDLARILGDQKDGRLRDLVASGQIPEAGRGRVALAQAVPVFFDALRADLREGSASQSAERARTARADAAGLNLAIKRRELIHVDEVEAVIAYLCSAINSGLAALPARVTRDPYQRRRVDDLIFKTRDAIGKAVGALAENAE